MKIRFDRKSLKFNLGLYFFLFTGILLLIIWALQIFFLNNYYQDMKVRETNSIASRIDELYKSDDRTSIRRQISEIYERNDMYIEIETEHGIPIFVPNVDADEETTSNGDSLSNNTGDTGAAKDAEETAANQSETTEGDAAVTPHLPSSVYRARIGELKDQLEKSGTKSISKQVTDPDTGLITLEYAAYLTTDGDDRNMLFIFSPLYPMQSTIEILSSQLVYILLITMVLALLVSLYLSNRITQPLSKITKAAQRLGQGEYGIVFEGAHYSEINELADTLTYTSMELAKTDSMQKDVIANVSHDLRTPLTMVISYAEMIRDLSGRDPVKRSEHLQVIIDEAERLNRLVTDLLEVSRMQSGEFKIVKSEFSLKSVIESQLQSYVGFVEQEGYKLIFISRGDGMVIADEARIKQVIANLVSNAFKYCGPDRTVEVRMLDEGDYVRCEVSDHGIGIPKRDLRHIWERYYKASTNYQRSSSSGLGLSIVKEILLVHGANFGVESALRKGSTFWFEIKKPEPAEIKDEETEYDEAHTTAPIVANTESTRTVEDKTNESDSMHAGGTNALMAHEMIDDDMTIAGERVSHSISASETEHDDDMIIIEDKASRKRAAGIRADENANDLTKDDEQS
jgi:signal transduction histidine kinase